MSWVKTFQIAKVENTDKTSVTCVIPKTIHCLIFAFRATNAVLNPDQAQPSWCPWPQECPLLKLSNRSFALSRCTYKYMYLATPEYKNLEMFRSLCIRNLHISHYAPYLPPKILHSLWFSFLLGIKAVPRGIENNAHAKFWGANEVHCHFQQCLNTLWKSPKGFLNVSDVDNCVQKPRQLLTMYCAVWLVDFWPITILVKCLTILIALFYVFWSRTAQTRAVTPLPVLVSFFTSRT